VTYHVWIDITDDETGEYLNDYEACADRDCVRAYLSNLGSVIESYDIDFEGGEEEDIR
jgi:hypothetical protein